MMMNLQIKFNEVVTNCLLKLKIARKYHSILVEIVNTKCIKMDIYSNFRTILNIWTFLKFK